MSKKEENFNDQPWTLRVDSNEHFDENFTKRLCSIPKLKTVVEQLFVADFAFKKAENLWCVIERKTELDMIASIHDGRYNDQACRMLKSNVPFMWFLVVSTKDKKIDPINRNKINSSMVHLQMQKNINVTYADGEEGMLDFFKTIFKNLCEDPSMEKITPPLHEDVKINCKKRKMEDHSSVFLNQLKIIEGVSTDKAKAVTFCYSDFPTLILSYFDLPDEKAKIEMLKELKVGTRKLGPVISERIYRCVMNKMEKEPKNEKKGKKEKKNK